MALELLKKITIRDIGTTEQLAKVVKEKVSIDLANIAGVARGVKSGTSSFGEWQGLTGDFVAVNCATGQEYRSSVCIIPSLAQDLVISALKNSDDNTGVDMAFTITAQPDPGKASGRGYKFGAKPLMQPKVADEVARLKALFPSTAAPQPAIEAPKVEAEPEKVPATPQTPAAKHDTNPATKHAATEPAKKK